MIQIRAWFGRWNTVDEEHARRFVRHMLSGMPAVRDPAEKTAIVEAKHLKGITVAELLAE